MRKKFIWIIVLLVLILVFGFRTALNFYVDLLWFQEVGYTNVFLKMLFTNWGLRLAQILLFFLFVFVNLLFVRNLLFRKIQTESAANVIDIGGEDDTLAFMRDFSARAITWLLAGISLLIALFFSVFNPDAWQQLLLLLNGGQFHLLEPVVGMDAGFYVFKLPFLRYIYELTSLMVGLTLLLLGGIYYFLGRTPGRLVSFSHQGQNHLAILGALFLLIRGWGYRLDIFRLLYSREGVVYGPGYTDVAIRLPALNFLSYFLFAAAILFIVAVFMKSKKHLPVIVIAWLLVAFLGGTVLPEVIQRFRVEPNEITLEGPYITNNIEFTNYGYGLHNVNEIDYPFHGELNWSDIADNIETIENLRVWDWRAILQTYRQLEERRPYYVFNRVDIDRYMINGEYRQVMLAPRELDQSLLAPQAQTWVNQVLKYTHGLGMVMSPVNTMTTEGFPELIIRDIPPVSTVDLEITNPSIYFGEKATGYVITNHRDMEFHYPSGDESVYKNYEGSGGIPIKNFLRKLLFAIHFQSSQILLAGDIMPESRLMFDRIIHDRVRKIAPFLKYDQDPYTVLHDGRIFWIQDAYTTSNMFPYSEPYGLWGNYIRNSVKIVIDAYNGTVDYYVVDSTDPIIQAYWSIFPELFKPLAEMPAGLKSHFRYPEDLFTIQSVVVATYHMKDFRVFYNKEDQWALPNEKYGDSTIRMTPYYTLMQLPDEEESQFILMLPFTPQGRNNMVAWMAAVCEPERYGELNLYYFPKDRLAYGPMQIEAQIDQNAEISQQISLWDQHGSRVIRGNLLVLPVNGSLLYIEPLFLQSEQVGLPQLRRIIMATGDRVVWGQTVEAALLELLGSPEEEVDIPQIIVEAEWKPPVDVAAPEVEITDETVLIDTEITDLQALIQRAVMLYEEGQRALQAADWLRYGQVQEELEQILLQLAKFMEEERLE